MLLLTRSRNPRQVATHPLLRGKLLGLLACFFISLLLFSQQYVIHHPDERHYTDAAIIMAVTGDYFTPHFPDGSLRMQKPILVYWMVLASYQLFGISPLASRLPFILAGCGVLWLTYRLGKQLAGKDVGLIAAAMLFCNPLLLMGATRSIPDVVLCLFLTMSALGFVQILLTERPNAGAYWLAYLGAGLAMASKGLPALVFLGYSLVFAVLNPWRRVAVRKLIHWPALATGALVAGSWFVIALALHGAAVWDAFWADQVENRVGLEWDNVPRQALLVPAGVVVFFLPWSVGVVISLLSRKQAPIPDRLPHRKADEGQPSGPRTIPIWCWYFLGWSAIWLPCMAVTVTFSERYFLPLSPLFAVLLAHVIYRNPHPRVDGALRLAHVMVGTGLVLLTILLFWVYVQLDSPRGWFAIAGGILGVTGLLFWRGLRGSRFTAMTSLAGNFFLGTVLVFLLVTPLVTPDQGQQIAVSLRTLSGWEGRPVGFVGEPSLASKVRVYSEGSLPLRPWDEREELFSGILISDEDADTFQNKNYQLHKVSQGFGRITPGDLFSAGMNGRFRERLEECKQTYYLATKRID